MKFAKSSFLLYRLRRRDNEIQTDEPWRPKQLLRGGRCGVEDKESIQAGFAWTVLAVWGASFIMSLFCRDYSTPVEIHAAFAMIGGWLFGEGIVKKLTRKNGGSNGAELDK